jgi:hypothetical protein
LLGFWTKFFLQNKVVTPCPTPNLQNLGVSLNLDSTYWPFWHGWSSW